MEGNPAIEEAKQDPATLQFLVQMRTNMIILKTRLNNEIKHKMALIKQVAMLKKQLKEAEEKAEKGPLLVVPKASPNRAKKIHFLQTIQETNNELMEASPKHSESHDDGRPRSYEDKSPALLGRKQTLVVKSHKQSLINDDEFRNKMRVAWRKQVNQKRRSTVAKSHAQPRNTNVSEENEANDDYDNLTRSKTQNFCTAPDEHDEHVLNSGRSHDLETKMRTRQSTSSRGKSFSQVRLHSSAFYARKLSDPMVQQEENNYWKERVDLLLYEKKNWMNEKKKLRGEMHSVKFKMDMLEQRNKHLQNVINRFGQFDKQEFEFEAEAGQAAGTEENDPKHQMVEIQSEYQFNK